LDKWRTDEKKIEAVFVAIPFKSGHTIG